MANAFALLPDEDHGDVDEFFTTVAELAMLTAEEEEKKKKKKKKKRLDKQEVEKMQNEQPENNVVHPFMIRPKIPFIPKWLYKSQIVFRKQKPEEKEGKDQEVDGTVKEITEKARENRTQRDNVHRQNNGDHQEGGNYYQGNHEGDGRYRRNYERANLAHRTNTSEGEQGQHVVNYERDNLYNQDDNTHRGGRRGGGRGRGRGMNNDNQQVDWSFNERGGRREWRHRNGDMCSADNKNDNEGEGRYRTNYGRGNLAQENNNGGEQGKHVAGEEGKHRKNYERAILYHQFDNNKNRGGGYLPCHGGRKGEGRGRGRGMNENQPEDGSFMSDKGGRREWKQRNGYMNSADSRDDDEHIIGAAVEVSYNVGRKELDDQTMTYQEYEKVQLEKKKALLAAVNSDKKPKASLDNKDEFESMKPIGKKMLSSKMKPNSHDDTATNKKDKVVSKEKGSSKSMSIDEFSAGYGGRIYHGERYGGRNGRSESNNGAEFRGSGGAFPGPPQPPKLEDVGQFPALRQ